MSVCSDSAEVVNECTTYNLWGITIAGYDSIKGIAGAPLIIDGIRAGGIVHFIMSFIGWLLYALQQRVPAALITALGHVAGWVVVGIAYSSLGDGTLKSVMDSLTQQAFTYELGTAIIASLVSSALQLTTVVFIIAERVFGLETIVY